jgi:LPS export ABC transporter protein LptC
MLFRLFTLLAVAALAISTWILSSPAHRPAPAYAIGQADLPGYYLADAVLTDYDVAGEPGIRLDALRIDQIDHGDEIALSDVRVHYQAPNGDNWVLTGEKGRVESGGKIVDVSGDVRLEGDTQPAGTVVLTDVLRYDVPGSIVTTSSDVRIEFGAHTLNARGLAANLKERTMRLEQRVNGRFQR